MFTGMYSCSDLCFTFAVECAGALELNFPFWHSQSVSQSVIHRCYLKIKSRQSPSETSQFHNTAEEISFM